MSVEYTIISPLYELCIDSQLHSKWKVINNQWGLRQICHLLFQAKVSLISRTLLLWQENCKWQGIA